MDVWGKGCVSGQSEIIMTDVLGRMVEEIRYTPGVRLDVSEYPPGLYFYRLEADGRVLDVGRVLVE